MRNKVEDITSLRLINGNCLIEIEDMFNRETESGILVGDVAYNKNVHAIRYGILARMPNTINFDKKWHTDSFPDEGCEVWFDYLDASEAPQIESKGKLYIILSYFRLILARYDDGSIKLLNGYMLAKKHLKKRTEMSYKDEYYDDIYDIVYAGKPNLKYAPDEDVYGNIVREFVDDPSICEGITVMTRASAYPILEESLHAKFSKDEYFYFQRKDVIGKVEEG